MTTTFISCHSGRRFAGPQVICLAVVTLIAAISPAWVLARTWTDSTGTHTIEAEFVELKDGSVQLKPKNGNNIVVPLARLSRQDRAYVVLVPFRVKVDGAKSAVDAAVRALKRQQEKEPPAGEDAMAIEKASAYLARISDLTGRLGKPSPGPPTPGIRGEVAVAVETEVEMPDGTKQRVLVTPGNTRQLLAGARAALAAAQKRARTNLSTKHKEELKGYTALYTTLAEANELLKTAAATIEPKVDQEAKLSDALKQYQRQVEELVQRVTEDLKGVDGRARADEQRIVPPKEGSGRGAARKPTRPPVKKGPKQDTAPEAESEIRNLPTGHQAKLLQAAAKADGLEITFVGKKQQNRFLLVVAFGTDADLSQLVNGMKDLIRGGFGDDLSISPPSGTSAVALRVRKIQLDGKPATVTVPLPSLVKGTGTATVQLFQAKGRYFAPVSNAVRTTVTIQSR